jgi:DNA-directed RNA polymerase subunit L
MHRSIATGYAWYVLQFALQNTFTNSTQLSGATETAASFQIDGEDHTLGNALRYIIHKK